MTIPGTIIIRPMTESDVDAVFAIEQASFPAPWQREQFLNELGLPFSFPFVAEADGAVVGYVCLMSLFKKAQIVDIATEPEQRGRGIARMLMEHATTVAREKGAEAMALQVRASNSAALNFFEKLGFEHTGTRRGFYEGKEDLELMEKYFIEDRY
jgi:ribosomal-protein-alanine N-acetyltransferase